jgi:hypothetical protein
VEGHDVAEQQADDREEDVLSIHKLKWRVTGGG